MKYFGFDKTLGQLGALRRLGFGQSGIEADFVAGTYSKDGVSKTFADLFTFSRAGKAWLVKDTGLQEYEADAPRFDNGLLIEQSATNQLINGATYVSRQVDFTKNGRSYRRTGYQFQYASRFNIIDNTVYILSTWFSNENDVSVPARMVCQGLISTVSGDSDFLYELGAGVTRSYVETATKNPDSNAPIYFLVNPTEPEQVKCGISYAMLEQGERVSSIIPTLGSAVTRPADYLLNKITGTTVTGDWDDTLTLSIVDGQLVHSGYGRIRSLEIY